MDDAVSLLSNCTSGGCGAKIGPGELEEYLKGLQVKEDPSLLVGFGFKDDAAVYKIDEEKALVSTVDFFSPMVDDPFLFGKIGAANALSDIYAMGGRPLYALNLCCFPERMDKKILAGILAGGCEKALEAGAAIAGGHSIYDHEPKYGLAVTGLVNPRNFFRNNGCRTGDALILTKALGVGLVMAALRGGEAPGETVKAATDSMERLNRFAAEKFSFPSPFSAAVHGCTDVTGFGLAVHGAEMAGEAHTLTIDAASLPVLPGALGFAENCLVTAAGQRNRLFMREKAGLFGLTGAMEEIVFDPQTSGGLLISVESREAEALLREIQKDDPAAALIGEVTDREEFPIIILG
jgi:selenide,water dikinase